MGLLESEYPEAAIRLRKIRNLAALGLQGEISYGDCSSQIVDLAQGKLGSPRKAKASRDRKERGGQDRSESDSEE